MKTDKNARVARAATTAELLTDLQVIPQYYHDIPVLLDEAGGEISCIELISFKTRVAPKKDGGFETTTRPVCVIRDVNLPAKDDLDLAVQRVRAEALPGQIQNVADMLNFYLDNGLETIGKKS